MIKFSWNLKRKQANGDEINNHEQTKRSVNKKKD